MNPEIKAKWITALCSGNYKQGRYRLRRASDNTFCCLGVLCDILQDNNHQWQYDGERDTFGFLNNEQSLPQSKLDEIGLPYHIQSTLMTMNDSEFKNFEEIAVFLQYRV